MTSFDGLALFRESLGAKAPVAGPALTTEQVTYVGRAFPEGYVGMLRDYGLGFYARRRFQFLDPAPFAPLVERMFDGDPQIDATRVHVAGVEAFGLFTLWSEQFFAMQLDVHRMHLTCADLMPAKEAPFVPAHLRKAINPAARTDPNNRARSLLPFEPEKADFWDVMNKPLFATAERALGPLDAGEIFAFDPPLASLGGALPRDPSERLVRIPALQALKAAADAAPLMLVDRVRGKLQDVRRIGSAS